MDANKIAKIVEHGYLFRGTSDKLFERFRNFQESYLGYQSGSGNEIRTSTSLRVIHAMSSAVRRNKSYKQDYSLRGCKPLLLAIDAKPYIDFIQPGDEFYGLDHIHLAELEITKPINFEDITIVNSVDTLERVCRNEFQILESMSFETDEVKRVVDYFNQYFKR